MAAPRRSGGNVRVITATVCGVISAAPRPWTARAMISMVIPSVPAHRAVTSASPHHSDDTVKITKPTR